MNESHYQEAMNYHVCRRLGECPEALDEAVAVHYSTLVETARSMKILCDHRRRFGADKNTNECIQHLKTCIQKAHVAAFGLPPNWPC
jgi:hypothetical protein